MTTAIDATEGAAQVPGGTLRFRLAGRADSGPCVVFENGWGASFPYVLRRLGSVAVMRLLTLSYLYASLASMLLLARRHPEELLVVGPGSTAIDGLLAQLAPGQASDAVALDLSHGMTVIAFEGPQLELWLSHLVDASAVPRRAGLATRTRLVDVAVVLIRLADETVWLVADRALSPYLANWLAFTHEGAFATAAVT
jgi:heterotetrameric sarcosine oxidase gamma subunit